MAINLSSKIPPEVQNIGKQLIAAGFEAYVVGGCLRDILLDFKPKDWDITTNATPEEIQKLFPESIYENTFGTVGVKTESIDASLKIIEITTFRKEEAYSDKRHPDAVVFSKSINDDLERRDFSINALALNMDNYAEIIDQWNGLSDLKKKLIRSVGDPLKRFEEDALRLMRAIRFAVQLNFTIEPKTWSALMAKKDLLKQISKERIHDELTKIIMTPYAAHGIQLMADAGILSLIIPELAAGIGVTQNKHHIYTVFDHNVRALAYSAGKGYSLEVRLASLLHDVGKPNVKVGEGANSTFYAHEIVGAKITYQILKRLAFSSGIISAVTHLVRNHLFYYNVGEVTEAGVRRFIKKVGSEAIPDLIKVREADRIGSGVPKAVPYRLRHLLFMIEKVKQDPISSSMLAIDGNDIMKMMHLEPGKKIGQILALLLDEILNDPSKNTVEYLTTRVQALNKLTDNELAEQTKAAHERKEEFTSGIEDEMKKRHKV